MIPLIALFFLTAPGLLPGQPASALAAEVLAPCADTGPLAGFLRPCAEVIEGRVGTANYAPRPGTLALLDQNLQTYVTKYYQGIKWDISGIKDSRSGTPVCNIAGSPFSGGAPELTTNSSGGSCGQFAGIDFRIFVPSCSCRVGLLIGCAPDPFCDCEDRVRNQSKIDGISITFNAASGAGVREQAYLRGAWVAALTCAHRQVRQEVQAARKLRNVEPEADAAMGGVSSLNAAQSINAAQVAGVQRAIAEIVEKAKTDLDTNATTANPTVGNPNEIWKCDTQAFSALKGAGIDVGLIRQSAQNLCANRDALEASFATAVLIETLARARRLYGAKFIDNPSDFFQKLRNSVQNGPIYQACVNEFTIEGPGSAESFCKGPCTRSGCGVDVIRIVGPDCSQCLSDWTTTRFKPCYENAVQQFFRDQMREWTDPTFAGYACNGA